MRAGGKIGEIYAGENLDFPAIQYSCIYTIMYLPDIEPIELQ